MNRPLPDFDLTDTDGRRWTKASLAGKIAVVAVWATWCGPCREELPHIARLHQDWKQREDVLVFTLNIDDNPGVLGPFLKEKNYSFPVLPAQQYVEDFISEIAIPRTWIVSPTGALRIEKMGFMVGQSYADFQAEITDAIERVKG